MFNISNRRYTGSKLKLSEWIIELIKENCVGNTFFEIFAGTSVVSSKIAPFMDTVILNDTLEANEVIYNAFYNNTEYNSEKLNDIRDYFNSHIELSDSGFFSENYGDKYFSLTDCRKIEFIRNYISENEKILNKKEYSILLTSLIYSMDRCANTVGHFDAYRKIDNIPNKFLFDLIQPFEFPNTDFKIFREDANLLAEKINADIVYIDPPYNSRQYCQFYHIYETIVRWDNPQLFGTALKPQGRHLSEYCKSKAPLFFADLIEKLNCNYIAVSYNNTYQSKSGSSRNKITLEQIEDILSKRGEVLTFSKAHQFFNAGKTDFSDHKEFLFIVKVNNK
ncbi:MAG: DNA adenine methylase [Oscillospiraceae bacterium]|nr:DNA adenine methylase [Oscillospiraceae bacterium]